MKKKPSNQRELTDGSDFHNEHWLQTQTGGQLRSAAWFLLLAALIIWGIYFGLQFIN